MALEENIAFRLREAADALHELEYLSPETRALYLHRDFLRRELLTLADGLCPYDEADDGAPPF
jgi:hypothetical protein